MKRLLFWIIFSITCLSGSTSNSSPSDDAPPTLDELRSRLDECTPWGKLGIYIKNKNGSYTFVDKVPYDLLCELDSCTMINGVMTPAAPENRNISLSAAGLYGLGSMTTPEFARLVVFRTKNNHSDIYEDYMDHGCEGTLHEDHLPPSGERWLAFIRRGNCRFTDKLMNSVVNHSADGFVVYNTPDQKMVIMDFDASSLVTIMINSTVGGNILLFEQLLQYWNDHLSSSKLPYTTQIYANISFSHCEAEKETKPPMTVTIVTITFIVIMSLSLTWLVIYYFQKHRNSNKQVARQLKLQKAAKKALKKIGERVIQPGDEELQPDNQQDCTYCLESLLEGEIIRELPCHHKFHKSCVDDWLIHNRSCPNCHGDILVATDTSIRGIKNNAPEDDEAEATELTDMTPDGHQHLLSDSQPISGFNEPVGDGSQYWGSQVIQGSQLLTDGQNFFLHVPNHIDLPPNTTIQIENPPPTLTISHQQLVAAEQQNLLNNPTPSTSAPAE